MKKRAQPPLQSLVSSSDDIETIDRLHALIVMAWTENGSGNSASKCINYSILHTYV